jgi:hypothetical protein
VRVGRKKKSGRSWAAEISLGRDAKVGQCGPLVDQFSNSEQGNLFCQQSLRDACFARLARPGGGGVRWWLAVEARPQ